MNKLLLIFLLFLSFGIHAQDEEVQEFTSRIFVFSGLGFTIQKVSNQVIVQQKGLNIKEDSSSITINHGKSDDNFLVLGRISGNDTINKQHFEFYFSALPDPEMKLACDTIFHPTGRIFIHKDSLHHLKQINIVSASRYIPQNKFEILKVTFYHRGMTGPPPTVKNQSELSDEMIESLKNSGDTIGFSLNATIRGQDGIARQIGGSYGIILLEGEAYGRHIDPQYDYKRYSDTIYITKEQLKNADTLLINNPGHLYIGFPRMKKEYEIDLDDGMRFCYDSGRSRYTKIPKGKGYFIYDAHNSEGSHTLWLQYNGPHPMTGSPEDDLKAKGDDREIYIWIER